MRDDPFYLSKDESLEASLGVLSVDGNFEYSIAELDIKVNEMIFAKGKTVC